MVIVGKKTRWWLWGKRGEGSRDQWTLMWKRLKLRQGQRADKTTQKYANVETRLRGYKSSLVAAVSGRFRFHSFRQTHLVLSILLDELLHKDYRGESGHNFWLAALHILSHR
jgi:hypothetical protein